MKKISALLVTFFACSVFSAAAASSTIKIYLNNTEMPIPAEYGQPFYDENKRLQMPVRYVLEKCGYSVLWDSQNHTVTVSGNSGVVVLTVGSNMMKTTHGNIAMDTAVRTKDNRTYLPLRYVLEELGSSVGWEKKDSYDLIKITSTGTASSNSAQAQTLTARQISDKVSNSVFFIKVFQDNELAATGSGFFIGEQGIAVTNYHVIDSTTSATAELTDGKTYPIEKVISYDKALDIAVIKVSQKSTDGTSASKFSPVILGNSDNIANGDKIYTIGSPEGFQNTISDGIISNKNRKFDDLKQALIQITAPISGGSSGGALVNEAGEVIGITNGGWTEGQSINFAIPINCLKNLDTKSDGDSYKDMLIKAFKKEIKDDWAEFGERLYDEIGDASYYNDIQSGDTYVGTFTKTSETDVYAFYTPIPVYVTVISGALDSQKYDSQLDVKAKSLYGTDWNSYVKESLRMRFESVNKKTLLTPEYVYDADSNPVIVIDKVKIAPGRYTISLSQASDNEQAWKDRDYFIYLSLEEA